MGKSCIPVWRCSVCGNNIPKARIKAIINCCGKKKHCSMECNSVPLDPMCVECSKLSHARQEEIRKRIQLESRRPLLLGSGEPKLKMSLDDEDCIETIQVAS